MTAPDISIPRARLGAAILLSGLAGGGADLLSAFVVYGLWKGVSVMRVCQSVASGWFGKAAYEGGLSTAAAGFASHFAIAIAAAAIYVAASCKIRVLIKRPVACGLLFGAAAWIVMNFVVVPLSAIGPRPVPPLVPLLVSISLNVLFFGPPIALVARRFATSPGGA